MVQKLAIFADVQCTILHLMLNCWHKQWVSEIFKKCADVIYGWFLTYQISGKNATNQNADGDNISCHVQSLVLLNLDSKSFVWTQGRVLTSWMICTKWLEVVRKSRDTDVNISWVVESQTFFLVFCRMYVIRWFADLPNFEFWSTNNTQYLFSFSFNWERKFHIGQKKTLTNRTLFFSALNWFWGAENKQ